MDRVSKYCTGGSNQNHPKEKEMQEGKEISSLSHSVVFLCFFALFIKKTFLSLLASLWNSTFRWVYLSLSPLPFASLLSSVICKASSDNHFAFLHFLFFGMVLVAASCTVF